MHYSLAPNFPQRVQRQNMAREKCSSFACPGLLHWCMQVNTVVHLKNYPAPIIFLQTSASLNILLQLACSFPSPLCLLSPCPTSPLTSLGVGCPSPHSSGAPKVDDLSLPPQRCRPAWPGSGWLPPGRPARCPWCSGWCHRWSSCIPSAQGLCPYNGQNTANESLQGLKHVTQPLHGWARRPCPLSAWSPSLSSAPPRIAQQSLVQSPCISPLTLVPEIALFLAGGMESCPSSWANNRQLQRKQLGASFTSNIKVKKVRVRVYICIYVVCVYVCCMCLFIRTCLQTSAHGDCKRKSSVRLEHFLC